ncbi:MAG: hypothetical protein PHP46_03925 [Candidatus Omnitrophica bacterium]|nr:hypothetical protein [Candidatus Omnitrophota bacterium]
MKIRIISLMLFSLIFISMSVAGAVYAQDDDSTRNVLKQGLLGAGVGAISSSASGGNAGQGALIGAGTSVIGSALLDSITGPSSSSRSSGRRYAPPPDDDYYYEEEPGEYYYEEPPPQESASSKIIKQGLVGAGTGALASGMSGGDAGKGALIGAGTAVIGNALLDTITQPAEQRRGRVYRRAPPPKKTYTTEQNASTDTSKKKIIKKYDDTGKLVSEEEIYY